MSVMNLTHMQGGEDAAWHSMF